MAFRDRSDAGKQLSEKLGDHADEDVVVLGLPRGGVPVAFEVAKALGDGLDGSALMKERKGRSPYETRAKLRWQLHVRETEDRAETL
jgi:glutamine phosphoribosylpyrophosphate amidotransferase